MVLDGSSFYKAEIANFSLGEKLPVLREIGKLHHSLFFATGNEVRHVEFSREAEPFGLRHTM